PAAFTSTTRFLVSHLAASILGAAIGNVGFAALFVLLVRRGSSGLALWALVAAVVGNTVATSVFGAAAFAQPAIGRMYLAGQTASAVALQDDVYGVPLFATALVGVLLLASGLVLFGSAIIRSGWLPRETWRSPLVFTIASGSPPVCHISTRTAFALAPLTFPDSTRRTSAASASGAKRMPDGSTFSSLMRRRSSPVIQFAIGLGCAGSAATAA